MTDANLIPSRSRAETFTVARPNLTTHCGRPKDDKTEESKKERRPSCMMKYKTTDSNLGSQCAVHHRDEHRIELGVLFHLIQE